MKLQDILKMKDHRRAHRILVDVPCSCTGVIRRHPELKWQLTESNIHELALIQRQILEVGANHVADNGILVYSACSLEPEETIELVEKFLDSHPEFVFDPFPERVLGWLDNALREHTGHKGYMQFFPHRHGTDGFFVARMKRIANEQK
jgi:16S rRNA (cytosine967-C5)-methyltransferase